MSIPSTQLFPNNTFSSFTNFLPKQLNLKGQWELAISEISYSSMYQNVADGMFMFFEKKLSKPSDFYYLGPCLYPSITDIVEVISTFNQETHNQSESRITVKVSRRMRKVETYPTKERSGLALFRTDLGHIFGSNVGIEFRVMLRAK